MKQSLFNDLTQQKLTGGTLESAPDAGGAKDPSFSKTLKQLAKEGDKASGASGQGSKPAPDADPSHSPMQASPNAAPSSSKGSGSTPGPQPAPSGSQGMQPVADPAQNNAGGTAHRNLQKPAPKTHLPAGDGVPGGADRLSSVLSAGLMVDSGRSQSDGYTGVSTLSGRARPGQTIYFSIDGKEQPDTATADGNGRWVYRPTNLADGAHRITSYTKNARGGVDQSIDIDLTLDRTAPDLTEGLKNDTGSLKTDRYTSDPEITGKGDPNSTIRLWIDGKLVDTLIKTDGNGLWSYKPKGLSDGTHKIVLRQEDAAGNGSYLSSDFTLDTVAPPISSELANDTGDSKTDLLTSDPTLKGKTVPFGIVRFYVDGKDSGQSIQADGNGNWSYKITGLADGKHRIESRVEDKAGNVGTSRLDLLLDTQGPKLSAGLDGDTGISSSDGYTSSATFKGKGEPNRRIEFLLDGKRLPQSIMTDANGNWQLTLEGIADGPHKLTATQNDAAGNLGSSQSLDFTLDRTAPDLIIDQKDSLVYDKKQRLTGTTEPHSTLEIFENGKRIGQTVSGADGRWSLDIDLTSGRHSLTIKATDRAGNQTLSEPLSYSVYSQSFTKSDGGDWFTGSNWSGGHRPETGESIFIGTASKITINAWDDWYRGIERLDTAAGSTLTITNGGLRLTGKSDIKGSIELNNGNLVAEMGTTIGSLTIGGSDSSAYGSKLLGDGDVTIGTMLSWTQGLMLGHGKTILAKGATALIGDGFQQLGRAFDIYGTANLVGAQLSLNAYDDGKILTGRLTVKKGGELTMDGGSAISASHSSSTTPLLLNEGLITIYKGEGTSKIVGIEIQNDGSMSIEGGKLDISNSSFTNRGDLRLSDGARLSGGSETRFTNSGTMSLSDNSVFDTNLQRNSGTINLSKSELNLGGDTTNSGTITVGDESGVFALGRLIGGGSVKLTGEGAYSELSDASDNRFIFGKSNQATLRIEHSDKFTGTVENFSSRSSVELGDLLAGDNGMNYVVGERGGRLQISDGQRKAGLDLVGSNSISDFDLKASSKGGSTLFHI